MAPQYQLPEHLYMIRYKCLWAMTVVGRDGVIAGGRQQMSEEDEQLRVRVAWLYFMEGLTQADIAGKLGITRLRANRLLGEARESGLVNIQVNARLAGCV